MKLQKEFTIKDDELDLNNDLIADITDLITDYLVEKYGNDIKSTVWTATFNAKVEWYDETSPNYLQGSVL